MSEPHSSQHGPRSDPVSASDAPLGAEPASHGETVAVDCLIIGGGIAGLWLLSSLRGAGYRTVLFESEALGSAQSAASQGIIHGGMKYALDGEVSTAARAIAQMPDIWRACLNGKGPVDLRACRVLSERLHLLPDKQAEARLTQVEKSGALASRLHKLSADYLHPRLASLYADMPAGAHLYAIDEPVLDVHSLITTLAAPHHSAIYPIDWMTARLIKRAGSVLLDPGQGQITPGPIKARQVFFCAGSGNAQLLSAVGIQVPQMQRRPLQQLLVRVPEAPPLFAHVIDAGNAPRLTITSHRLQDKDWIWYLGGDLANLGAEQEAAVLIGQAAHELNRLFPSLRWADAQWSTLTIDRAEALNEQGQRPDDIGLMPVPGADNVLVAWPTKLALCPRLGDAALSHLREHGAKPGEETASDLLPPPSRPVPVAAPPWEAAFA